MTALTVMQQAAAYLQGRRPSTFFSSQDNFEVEIVALLNEVAADIMKSHDWRALTKVETFEGDGVTVQFPLPSDYDRMPVSAEMQDANPWLWGYYRYYNVNDWLYAKARGTISLPGGWIVLGGQFEFYPAPGSDTQFPYISREIIRDRDGVLKESFTQDDDSFVLNERLLRLGIIWRWKEQKGLESASDYQNYLKALSEEAGRDGGSTVIRRNRSRAGHLNLHPAWPWELG